VTFKKTYLAVVTKIKIKAPFRHLEKLRHLAILLSSYRLGWLGEVCLGKVRLSWFHKTSTAMKLLHFIINR